MTPADIELANKIFPKMPADVFDQWILTGIKWYGFKFTSPFDSLINTGWDGYFGRKTMAFFAAADWSFAHRPLSFNLFHFEIRQKADWIIGHATKGNKTPTADVHNTTQRFRACASFIRENGNVPRPLVGYWIASQIDLVDGNHRFAALVDVFGYDGGFHLPIWTATTPKL